MSAQQCNADSIVEEYLKKKAAEEQEMLDKQPQPFSQKLLVQYFVEDFNTSHKLPLSKEELEFHSKEVIKTIRSVLGMTRKEAKEFFDARDEERRRKAVSHNDHVVFDYCLTTEITKLGLSGKERDDFRAEREAAYISGEFDYSEGEKQAQEILIRMQDVHFPEGSKKLMDVDTTSTFDMLLEKQIVLDARDSAKTPGEEAKEQISEEAAIQKVKR